LGHFEQKFWKITKEPASFTIFLEVTMDDEVTTLVPLNKLCGLRVNIFSKI
jgi:hypothetical protein